MTSVEFTSLTMSINVLTIDGKAVPIAVWDQIPEIAPTRWGLVPPGSTILTPLGWVNRCPKKCGWAPTHKHYVGVAQNNEPAQAMVRSVIEEAHVRDYLSCRHKIKRVGEGEPLWERTARLGRVTDEQLIPFMHHVHGERGRITSLPQLYIATGGKR